MIGIGSEKDRAKMDWPALGGFTASKVSGRAAHAALILAGLDVTAENAADFALGARLRHYSFDRYKTKKKPEGEDAKGTSLTLMVADAGAAEAAATVSEAVSDGFILARELVNEPPNVLYPEEFARRAEVLTELGVEVEVLGPGKLEALGMRALLAVAQGSTKEARVVVMRWNGGADPAEAPIAFIGKGVCFDSGGISIKSAGGMEDMKGDMGGAACVVGTMHALAARKARGERHRRHRHRREHAGRQRPAPGDIVTSMSGQTIEIINTDAEGRLVLADVIWHVQGAYKPKFMIDLATLTGAIIVALGQDIAGMYSNDDALSAKITAAGEATGEAVWRMPLIPAYDKAIDSKFADMKNSGGRHGGAATAPPS